LIVHFNFEFWRLNGNMVSIVKYARLKKEHMATINPAKYFWS
jgi:hypothetical protein